MTPLRSASYRYEAQAWRTGVFRVAGVDEAGRGPLAGPVVAAAVVLDPDRRIKGLRQGAPRPDQVRARRPVHGLRLRAPQGVRDPRAPDRAGSPRPLPDPPADLQRRLASRRALPPRRRRLR